MIKIQFVDKFKYIYCDSCGKENINLIRIKAFQNVDYNHNAVTLCKECLDDLRKVIIGTNYG